MTKNIEQLIEVVAARHFLNPALVKAVVQVESSGDTFAYRFEPRYRYLWNVRTQQPFRRITESELLAFSAPSDFPALTDNRHQEWFAQRASWGLMQVMGAVAREHGFKEPFLSMLTSPDIGLMYGCRVLQRLLQWSEGVVDQALGAYNGGRVGNERPPYRNAAYIAKVHAALKAYES